MAAQSMGFVLRLMHSWFFWTMQLLAEVVDGTVVIHPVGSAVTDDVF
jgi:hypothetical protein